MRAQISSLRLGGPSTGCLAVSVRTAAIAQPRASALFCLPYRCNCSACRALLCLPRVLLCLPYTSREYFLASPRVKSFATTTPPRRSAASVAGQPRPLRPPAASAGGAGRARMRLRRRKRDGPRALRETQQAVHCDHERTTLSMTRAAKRELHVADGKPGRAAFGMRPLPGRRGSSLAAAVAQRATAKTTTSPGKDDNVAVRPRRRVAARRASRSSSSSSCARLLRAAAASQPLHRPPANLLLLFARLQRRRRSHAVA